MILRFDYALMAGMVTSGGVSAGVVIGIAQPVAATMCSTGALTLPSNGASPS
jgi:hypothetical protein